MAGQVKQLQLSGGVDVTAPTDLTLASVSVADITALKAITAAQRVDNQLRLVDAERILYQFDSAASDTGDDYWIVTPDAGTGRWFRVAQWPGIPVITLTDNTGSPTNVSTTYLDFNENVDTSIDISYEISRTDLFSVGTIRLVWDGNGSTWLISNEFSFDDPGVTFSVTAGGVLQYTSTSTGNNASFKISEIKRTKA